MAKIPLGLPRLSPAPTDTFDTSLAYAQVGELFAAPVAATHPKLALGGQHTGVDELTSMIWRSLTESRDKTLENTLAAIGENTFSDFPTRIERPDADLLYAYAATARAGWDAPRTKSKPILIYTPDDVIEGADEMRRTGSTDKLTAALTYCYEPKTLGIVIESEQHFLDMLNELKLYTAQHVNDPATWKLFGEFDALTLGDSTMTQGILLRKKNEDTLDPGSFGTVLLSFLMDYTARANNTSAVASMSLLELVAPRSIVFINATAHAAATPSEINTEWMKLIKSIDHPLNLVNFNKITKLDAALNTYQKMTQPMADATAAKQAMRRAQAKFRVSAPTSLDVTRQVEKIMRSMGHVNFSNNTTTTSKRSPLRQSRRQPTNPNAFGRIHKTSYYPDMHVYLDCSGSISVHEQKDGLLAIVRLAKKFNCDLYFSSFSDVLSQEVLVPIKGRSMAQIWKYILSIPKVGGGTDFKQISDYVMASPERQARLSLVVTDFGWRHRGAIFAHPKNLYYAPCSTRSWANVTRWCKEFVESMHVVEPRARTLSRCLGMFA